LARQTGRARAAYVGQRAATLLNAGSWVHPGSAAEVGIKSAEPVWTELGFGGRDGVLQPLRITCGTTTLQIGGRLDRLDVSPDGRAWVVDYKLGRRQLSLRRFFAGADIQLPLYLLALSGQVLEHHGRRLELKPWQAVLQGIEPYTRGGRLEFGGVPVLRPVGILKAEVRSALSGGVLRDWLLACVGSVAAELGASLLAGEISPLPLRDGQWTACGSCPFRSVCRFDPHSGDRYRELPAVDLKELQERLAAGEVVARPPLPGLERGMTAGEGH
jgi:ATP-dependent helicase/nuclease subunit B